MAHAKCGGVALPLLPLCLLITCVAVFVEEKKILDVKDINTIVLGGYFLGTACQLRNWLQCTGGEKFLCHFPYVIHKPYLVFG